MGNSEPLEIVLSLGLLWTILFLITLPATLVSAYFVITKARYLWARRWRDRAISDAARSLALPVVRDWLGAVVADGRAGDFRVRIEGTSAAIRITITGSRLPTHFEIWGGEPTTMTTGDAAFDWVRFPRGPDADVLARLDAPTRAWLVATRATLIDGALVVVIPGRSARLADETRAALAIAEHLASTRPSVALLQISQSDPVPAVRENAEHTLTQYLPASPEAQGVFREWLAHPTTTPRRQALARLFLDQPRQPGDVDEIAKLLADRGAQAILDKLIGGGAASERLLTDLLVLVWDAHAVRILDALGRFGTASSVEPLKNHTALPGSATAAALARAVDQIQARLEDGGGGAGQLALAAEGSAGALALDQERGAMTLAPANVTKH